ncbi:ParB N-terminal domain-containing protein [uncultured Sulfitobacter sp.]|uniref:ParB/RepB/Spo0J family partition protein n=1 Tax=uncultured Sulfitobacter sp. TaxID=191468 RepID=UPI00261A271F|nr:ParB N-terminal domain-containing protein [uncultured Sulfitobacter sp.]
MAKRKRLTPANPTHLEGDSPPEKNMKFPTYPQGVAPNRSAPIADVAGDAAMAAAFEEVTQVLSEARASGRMVLDLPLDAVDASHLVRDRVVADSAEMDALKASLRARGQQAPIEVADLGGGQYGLISGWRRLTALRALQIDGGGATVQALIRHPADASDAYLAMVEENEIRVGLSYFERARIALKAVEQGVFPTHKAALLSLYHAASRPKRSKIRSFLTVVEALDGHLAFPGALGERLGLALSKALEADATLVKRLRTALVTAQTSEDEQRILEQSMRQPKVRPSPPEKPPGVEMRTGKDGSITLHGAGVTPELRKALEQFIRDWT